jgi:hypothetical protein
MPAAPLGPGTTLGFDEAVYDLSGGGRRRHPAPAKPEGFDGRAVSASLP